MSETESAYVVLRQTVNGDDKFGWKVIGKPAAGSASQAIRSAVTALPANDRAGTFVAVPARSWKPVTVRAEQTVTLKLENAG